MQVSLKSTKIYQNGDKGQSEVLSTCGYVIILECIMLCRGCEGVGVFMVCL